MSSNEDDEVRKLVFKEVIDLNERTSDVLSDTTFQCLMINPTIIETLKRYGFQRPSPVQAKALPLGLLGMDLLVQAKTGTGKTLVFAVLCADQLINASFRYCSPHVMIVSPTREIAMQSYEVVRRICPKNFFHGLFVGGIDMEHDKNILRKGCQVAVGTSGRLAHLVKTRILNPKKITLFVLDEADKLMEDSFKKEINFLFSSLTPGTAQVCVFSATYPRNLDQTLCNYMTEPSLVRLNTEDCQLIGIKQYVVVEEKNSNIETLLLLLNSVIFTQCLVFSNDQKKCTEICDFLMKNNVLASHFSASLSQEERFKVMKDFKNFRIRILVSSDLSARGIDAEHVNFIINVESPQTVEGYLHRIGRAGRFGTKGAALTILSNDKELYRFKLLVHSENLKIKLLDLRADYANDLPTNFKYFDSINDFNCDIADDTVTNLKKLNLLRNKKDEDDKSLNNKKIVEEQSLNNVVESKPMFVSMRPAHRKKYYLRKELLAIRDIATNAEWSAFGHKYLNFDTSETIKYLSKPLNLKDKAEKFKSNENFSFKMQQKSKTTIKDFKNSNRLLTIDKFKEYENWKVDDRLLSERVDSQKYLNDRAENVVLSTNPQLFERMSCADYKKHINNIMQMLDSDDLSNPVLKKILANAPIDKHTT